MTDIVKGMARAFAFEHDDPRDFRASEAELVEWYSPAMRAALLWAAANVSDDMVHHVIGSLFKHRPPGFKFEYRHNELKEAIAAVIRAAAGEEGK